MASGDLERAEKDPTCAPGSDSSKRVLFWSLHGVRAPRSLLVSITPLPICLSQKSPSHSMVVPLTNPPHPQDLPGQLGRT